MIFENNLQGGEQVANNYVENVCGMLHRKGLAPKYEHPGIYCIKLDGKIVYIGKSNNMLVRVAQHYVGIKKGSEKKYRILAEAQRKGHQIDFDVLYDAKGQWNTETEEEIGSKEGEYIRLYLPVLNTQIPKAEDWRKWDVNAVDAREVLKQLL